MDDEKFGFLRKVYFLKDLSDGEIDLISGKCHEDRFDAGHILFSEGSVADRFFIVIEGKVEVWKNFNDARPDLLAVHGSGNFFGELALVDDLPRSATVVAREKTRVLCLYRDDFHSLVRSRASIALSVMMSLSSMIRKSNDSFVDDLRRRNQELERTNKELKEMQGDAIHNERLSTLGKFSSMILHDIRNPISLVKSQLQLIALNGDDTVKRERYLMNATQELERLERLASEFLDYSRGEIRLNLSVTTLSELFERTRTLCIDRFEKDGIGFEIENGYEGHLVIDGERMIRVFVNIAENARKAMAVTKGTLLVRSRIEDPYAIVEFIDSGEGMNEETLMRVFEPFYSSSKQGGSGLGMLIVKNVIDAHSGIAEIMSKEGKGTTVRIRLPHRV